MVFSFDPQKVPVSRSDERMAAVPSERLSGSVIRQRFPVPAGWQPEIATERRFTERAWASAAVLIPLVTRDDGLTVLLTQRTDQLTSHPGQISFPGGRTEAQDADATATALREAEEEIGVPSAFVDVLGPMPTYSTGSGFIVTPVVALLRPGFGLKADPSEVADIFEVPLAFLMNPAHHRWLEIEFDGARREFLSMPWDGRDSSGKAKSYCVWGATAAMLRNLYRLLIDEA